MLRGAVVAAALIWSIVTAHAAEGLVGRVINAFPAGSISQEEGLENWQRFYEIASHPRCSNCHVGADNVPMWSGPSYGKTRPHGMSINAGNSRVGAETVPCGTCHTTQRETNPATNEMPHSPPKVAMAWALAPVQAEWFGKSSDYICNQLKDPDRNGGRSIKDLAAHLDHDLILHWAWNPGGTREPVPYSLQESMDFLMKWAAAGTPCPGDG